LVEDALLIVGLLVVDLLIGVDDQSVIPRDLVLVVLDGDLLFLFFNIGVWVGSSVIPFIGGCFASFELKQVVWFPFSALLFLRGLVFFLPLAFTA
jgi:hypothetical protein